MLDGTWQLVKVAGWQHGGGRWRCLLQWGVEGTVYEGWYLGVGKTAVTRYTRLR